MIQTPLPTPYDITGLPSLPITPEWWWWLCILATASILVLLLRGLVTPSAAAKPEQALKSTLESLKEIATSELSAKEQLAEGSLVARRFLTVLLGEETRSASPKELDHYVRTSPDLGRAMTVIQRIESLRFSEQVPTRIAGQLLMELANELSFAARGKELHKHSLGRGSE